MKKIKNPFQALMELRNVGNGVVAVRFSMSVRLNKIDAAVVSDRIIEDLLPDYVGAYRLFDDSYILTSCDDEKDASNMCIPNQSRSLSEFDVFAELEDNEIHTVHFSLGQSDSIRRDYVVQDSRFILLRGEMSINVEDNEESEN